MLEAALTGWVKAGAAAWGLVIKADHCSLAHCRLEANGVPCSELQR